MQDVRKMERNIGEIVNPDIEQNNLIEETSELSKRKNKFILKFGKPILKEMKNAK